MPGLAELREAHERLHDDYLRAVERAGAARFAATVAEMQEFGAEEPSARVRAAQERAGRLRHEADVLRLRVRASQALLERVEAYARLTGTAG